MLFNISSIEWPQGLSGSMGGFGSMNEVPECTARGKAERNLEKTEMVGVREYAEGYPVTLGREDNNRWVIGALNEGTYNGTTVDLLDLLDWLRTNRSELLGVG